MTPQDTQAVDEVLLRVLQANKTRFGLPAQGIVLMARSYAVELTEAECEARMAYLCLKGLAEEVNKDSFHPENSCWKISKNGVIYLDERGL